MAGEDPRPRGIRRDICKIKELLETFEEKAKLVKILSACLNTREAGVNS